MTSLICVLTAQLWLIPVVRSDWGKLVAFVFWMLLAVLFAGSRP